MRTGGRGRMLAAGGGRGGTADRTSAGPGPTWDVPGLMFILSFGKKGDADLFDFPPEKINLGAIEAS